MPVRIEEILTRIRREIAEDAQGEGSPQPVADVDSLPAIASRAELEYLNRNYAMFDPASPMHSHRRWLGPIVLAFKRRFRNLVLGVLDRYFEKERLFLLELVRFENALAERSDRLLREVTERTKAVAERNDLFLGALDLRLEALEAREAMRGALADAAPAANGTPGGDEEIAAEIAAAFAGAIAERLRPFVAPLPSSGPIVVLGGGGGEALDAFASGAAVRGVETSPALVAACRARGAAVELASLSTYLESLPAESVVGVVITRLAERHALAGRPRLVAAAWRALGPAGVLVCEGVDDAARLRWLLARQRFAIVEVSEAAEGAKETLIAARKGDGG